jgi:hypothetical protein
LHNRTIVSDTTVAMRSLILALVAMTSPVIAQQVGPRADAETELPDAPGVAPAHEDPGQAQGAAKATAIISGTVLDTNGDVIQGARVVVSNRTGTDERVLQSGTNGEFTFYGLAPGFIKLTVTGPGMGTFVSPSIPLHAGEMRIISDVVLPIAATSTNVTVIGDREELAEEQVQIAVEQRVFGVFPNFYSTYDWNAPPMGTKQKYKLAFRSVIDPVSFAGAVAIAGFEQYNGTFPGYGGGMRGFAKRFGAAYANDVSGRMLSSAVFPSLFHQDPRYFYKGTGTVQSRAIYAIRSAFITRDDNARWRPNYSHVLGNFTAGALANLYYPSSSRGVSLTLITGIIETAGQAGNNILREFVLRGITSHVPGDANGKP